MNKFVIPIIAILIVILLGALGYYIFQNQKLIGELSKTPSATEASPKQSPVISPSPEVSPSPQFTTALTQNAIKTNVASKNYQGLTEYMTNPVHLILEATECCGTITPAEAVAEMSYIDEGIPLDFNQNSATIVNLKAKNPALANKYIGISQTKEHLAAFGLDAQNKISEILLSVSWKLYVQ